MPVDRGRGAAAGGARVAELVSTSHAEGIEDRTALAGLGARRLADMVDLGRRLVAIELVVGAQAVELRGLVPMGDGTVEVACVGPVGRAVPRRRRYVVPDVEPLVDLLATSALPGRAA